MNFLDVKFIIKGNVSSATNLRFVEYRHAKRRTLLSGVFGILGGAFFVFMGWDCVRIYAMYFWWDIFTLFWFTMAYCMVVSIWE